MPGLGETIVIKRLDLLSGDRVRIISGNRTEYPPNEARYFFCWRVAQTTLLSGCASTRGFTKELH
ncbi:MAG: hypothetical protein JRJ73_09505 [Deltaproteobacteria bacterium]|nr:hypothetical protein [Deltaproteobacteria bacterium]